MQEIASLYRSAKLWLMGAVPISNDAFHIYIGFFVFVLVFVMLRGKSRGFVLLLPVFLVSVALEVLDLTGDISILGQPRWGASLHDIINTNIIPLVLYLLLRITCRRSQ